MFTTRTHLLSLILLTVAMGAPVRADEEEKKSLLHVSGDGKVRVEPDIATARLGATVQKKTAAQAQEAVNKIMNDVVENLKELEIPERFIQTTGLTLSPVYKQPGEGGGVATIEAYRASNTVSIRVTDLKKVGDAIDAAVKAGATELQNISFDVEDKTRARQAALQRAAESARSKAQTIAQAMGVELGPIFRITESSGGVTPYAQRDAMRAMAAQQAVSTPVQPGQVVVSASLTVEYELGGASRAAQFEDERQSEPASFEFFTEPRRRPQR